MKKNKRANESNEMRLNKLIAESGLCSRRKADELIKSGAVKINGGIVIELGIKVKRSDKITVNGDPIATVKSGYRYYILNKPKDCITTTDDEKGRFKVTDIIKTNSRIYPVGRLDRNTTGVLLLTDDGDLAHRLTHPRYQIEKIYTVMLDRELKFSDARVIAAGVELEDGKTSPCEILINPEDKTKLTISLTEGRNREVRRMFEHFGYDVKRLDRKMFAGLSHSGLKRSQYRMLSRQEIKNLRKRVKLDYSEF